MDYMQSTGMRIFSKTKLTIVRMAAAAAAVIKRRNVASQCVDVPVVVVGVAVHGSSIYGHIQSRAVEWNGWRQ